MDLIGPGLFWLLTMVALLVVEAITVGLTSLWFAAGALAALLASFWTENIWIHPVFCPAHGDEALCPASKRGHQRRPAPGC